VILPTGRQEGFTLIEVLVVLVLISIMATMIFPAFSGFLSSITLNTNQRKVINFFKQVRMEAITSGTLQVIVVQGNKLIWFLKGGEPFIMDQGWKELQTDAKDGKIIFYPDGTCSDGKLKVVAPNHESLLLSLDPISGEIKAE
jgi:prepilin-type N-terminal cleavage/methylation domain-containing protein